MKIDIIAVSKSKSGYITDIEEEYLKRLRPNVAVNLHIIKETPLTGSDVERVRREEGESILKRVSSEAFIVALDAEGRHFSSEEFAELLAENRDFKGGYIQFIIGGPAGLSEEVRSRADLLLSLSKMTFTHQMARVILLEQIYRAFEILRGSGYHK